MGDEPIGTVTHADQRELDVLRRRAYGPDADIFDDPAALARLAELEDRARPVRAGRTSDANDEPSGEAIGLPAASGVEPPGGDPGAPGQRRTPGWHRTLVATAAVVAVVLGGAAWYETAGSASADRPSAHAKTAAVASARQDAGYEVGYQRYMNGLRDEVLSLPGGAGVFDRMIRDQLRPYGTLYGRTVAAGPTVDHEFCMIIADLPESSVTCIPVENAYANPVSVQLPSWFGDADSDLFTGLGELVTYTLMPGGGVVALPADSAG